MIEEQIDRESERRSTAPKGASRGDGTRRRTTTSIYIRQKTGNHDQTSGIDADEDEYDVDYDNLVVSDILGFSGVLPQS